MPPHKSLDVHREVPVTGSADSLIGIRIANLRAHPGGGHDASSTIQQAEQRWRRVFGMALILAQWIACTPNVVDSGGGPSSKESSDLNSRNPLGSPCDCIAAYGGDTLGDDALAILRDNGLPECFHKDDPAELDRERACLPFVVGNSAAAKHPVEVYYFCSDVCPDYGRVGIRFSGITDPEACCAIDGIPLFDPAWGGFEACVPYQLHPMVPWVGNCQ